MSRIIENPKQLILNTAKQIMYQDGFEKLSIRNVAKNCDISIGTIYNYYPTKKELVIDLMAGYWDEYFCVIDAIFDSTDDTFSKLHLFYKELNTFIKKFKEVWLMDKLYGSPDIIKSGIKKENAYMELLFNKIEKMLSMDKAIIQCSAFEKIGPRKLSEFILLNIITIIQMPAMSYETFETILKELIS